MQQFLKLPDIRNIAAGATCVLTLPVGGWTYDAVILDLTNITITQLDNIRVKVNGKEIQFYEDAQLLQDINDYYGRAAVANQYVLFFARPEMVDLSQARLTALGTLDVQTLTIEADIDAACVAPNITAKALVSAPSQLNLITKVRRYPFAPGAAGQFECDGIVKGPRIAAIHFRKAADDVTSVQIEDGGRPILQDMSNADLEFIQKNYGRVPQALFTHVDFMLEGSHGGALVTAETSADGSFRTKPLRIIPTVGSAASMPVYVEYLDGLAGI